MIQRTLSRTQSVSPLLVAKRLMRLIVCGIISVASIAGVLRADQDLPHEALPTAWKSDAELTDVFFLNARLGWAVGSQGVILRTTDGGKQWSEISQAPDLIADEISLEQKFRNMRSGTRSRYTGIAGGSSQAQQTPIRCRFESICFIDAKHGWIAGGYEVPYVGRSRAVVMRTADGGQSWESIRSLVIPRINKIHFTDQLSGWAVGRTGNLFQTGVFYTSNGGQTWSSKSSAKMPGWTDAVKTSQGLLTIDYNGMPGLLLGSNDYEASVIRQDRMARINQVTMIDNQQGWAVGEQGSLLKTADGGRSFTPLDLDSSDGSSLNAAQPNARIAALIQEFDLRTVAATSTKVWFAGDPGTLLFALDRQSGNLTTHRLPIQSRINKISFADDQNGWAVGAMGCIVATNDGGQTWALQRSKNRTAAILVINSSPRAIGYELYSKYASQENHVCASVLLNSSEQQLQIVTQATDRLGGASSSLIASIDDPESATKELVRLIRSLQPRLVVLNADPAEGGQSGNIKNKIQLLVNEAIRLAGDRSAYDRQVVDAGLKPWQVSRLATRDIAGTVSIDARQLLPRTGKLIEDQIAISRAISGQSVLPEKALSYRITELARNGRLKAGDLLSGLGQDPNTMRTDGKQRFGNLTSIHQASAKQKTFDQFLKFESNTPQDFLVWRQQVQAFAMKMESDVAGAWLMQLAERYFSAGKPELAAASTELLVTRWSEHAFAPAALTWLAHYYGSDEFGQIEYLKRVRSGQIGKRLVDGSDSGSVGLASVSTGKDFQTVPQVVQAGGVSQLVWAPVKELVKSQPAEGAAEEASTENAIANLKQQFFEQRHQKAGQFLKQLGRRDPELVASLQYQLMEAQLARQISGAITNESRWKNLAQRRELSDAGVSIGANRELVIGGFSATSNQPVQALSCLATQTRPQLNGNLNDACWGDVSQSGNGMSMVVNLGVGSNATAGNQAQSKPDVVLMTHDDQFLYVGLVCQKVKGHYYNLRKQTRPRDPDLSRRDRVELSIDIDRDYRSSFEFVVDHRGWVSENCAGSQGWNPDWYVAQSENETTWTVEIAIPLEQIAAADLDDKTVWAFAIKRKIFDDRNVWDRVSEDGLATGWAGSTTFGLSGLQIGRKSNPSGFELLRFVE